MLALIQLGLGAQSITLAEQGAMPDTTGLYRDREDSLSATVLSATRSGSYLPRGKDIRAEVITAAGLCKMACCNLAESFENSASVTVGYSDAITGARQIRLLGQNGIYTQMLDENRPVMRGLSAPFGLNYVPGQWLESIQIAKGVTSVINGVESMTGQINMEHRKPTDEKPLYIQASVMNDTKTDLNVISSLQLDEMEKWSTVILGHVSGNFEAMDMNTDGFMDDPRQLQLNLSNRWLYFDPDGMQVRFGVRAIQDRRTGGQMAADGWRSDILNRSLGAYAKVGVPLNEDNTRNAAAVLDYTLQDMDSDFGPRVYDARQHSAFINLLYQDQSRESHHFTLGLSAMYDLYDETFQGTDSRTPLLDAGAFGEYTFRAEDKLSVITGLRADLFTAAGATMPRISPRLTVRWMPNEAIVLRANGGRGLRFSTPLTDNLGVLSTGKLLTGELTSHPLEDAWTFGGNATWYIGGHSDHYLSLDVFHTGFSEQMLVDYTDDNRICFYTLSSLDGGRSTTDNLQLDYSITPVRGLTLTLTGRLTDARQTLTYQGGSDIKPMTSLYKGVFNAQYATRLQKWIFDFTASVNGPCKMWAFMDYDRSPVYPLLYAQITKRFKGFDIYAGGENLTGFTQKNPIIGADNPYAAGFDASCIWGPLMGVRLYAGVRMTIWKME